MPLACINASRVSDCTDAAELFLILCLTNARMAGCLLRAVGHDCLSKVVVLICNGITQLYIMALCTSALQDISPQHQAAARALQLQPTDCSPSLAARQHTTVATFTAPPSAPGAQHPTACPHLLQPSAPCTCSSSCSTRSRGLMARHLGHVLLLQPPMHLRQQL